MKVNDSGMPDEAYWESLFDIEDFVGWLRPEKIPRDVAEVGCGYGTFSLPVAERLASTLHCYDIEPGMVDRASVRARERNLRNIDFHVRDVVENGFGESAGSRGSARYLGCVILFNILHFDGRLALLRETGRMLADDGFIAIIHWQSDIETPRGPARELRPTPDLIIEETLVLDLEAVEPPVLLGPYHWGLKLRKTYAGS